MGRIYVRCGRSVQEAAGHGFGPLALWGGHVGVELEEDAVGAGRLDAQRPQPVVGHRVGQDRAGAAGVSDDQHPVPELYRGHRGVEEADVGQQTRHDQVPPPGAGDRGREGRIGERVQRAVTPDPVLVTLGRRLGDLGQVGAEEVQVLPGAGDHQR